MVGRKQFDVEAALDAAMIQFWRAGYAPTSVDDLSRATGLNRSSLYSSFGDKDALFLRCLERYTERYGSRYDAALSSAAEQPRAAVRAFFEVTLERIADPDLPNGCLVAQSALAIPVLSGPLAERTQEMVSLQVARLEAALSAGPLPGPVAGTFAVHLAAVNHSLAVMSRAGTEPAELRAIVAVSLGALEQALSAA